MLNCCRALLTALPQTTAETYQTCSSLRGPSPENFSNYLPDEAALPCCIRSVRAKFQHPRAKTVAAKGHESFCWLTDWQSDPQSCWSQLKSFYFMKHMKRWRKVTKDKLATASCHHAEWTLLLLHWTFSLLTFNTRSILNLISVHQISRYLCSSNNCGIALTHQSGPRLISISGTSHKTNNMCINMCMNMYNTCVLGSCQLTSVLSPNSIHGYSPKEKGSFQPSSFLTGLQCTGPRMNRSSHHVWPTFSHNAAFADLSDRPFSQHTFDSS